MEPLVINYQELAEKIKFWGQELGFEQVGITDVDLSDHEAPFIQRLFQRKIYHYHL